MTEYSVDPIGSTKLIPTAARMIGWGGLLPIAVLTVFLWTSGNDGALATARFALQSYAAIILAFLGGINWGMGLRQVSRRARDQGITASIAAPLVAWGALFLEPRLAFGLLAAAFAGQGAWDAWWVYRGLGPRWYGRLRMELTAATALLIVAALLAAG